MFKNKSAWFSSSVSPACQQFWSKFIVFSQWVIFTFEGMALLNYVKYNNEERRNVESI